jgi:hypothetical protein
MVNALHYVLSEHAATLTQEQQDQVNELSDCLFRLGCTSLVPGSVVTPEQGAVFDLVCSCVTLFNV